MKEVLMLQRRMWFNVVLTMLISVMLVMPVTSANAGEFPNALSLQGFTGIMNIPTANVQKEGTMAFWYAKQRDHLYPYEHEDNYLFSVGMFSLLEAGGRVAVGKTPSQNNDLSAQFKVTTAPFTPKGYSWLPSLAVGVQDIGLGTAGRFYRSTYLVATEEINRFRFSLGYGFGPDRMDGIFGGAEIKAFDWLYLLGEYDTKDTNVGVRVVSPDLFGYPVNLQSTLKSSVNKNPGTIDFTVGIQFSLGKDWQRAARNSIVPTGTGESVRDPGTKTIGDSAASVAVSPVMGTGPKDTAVVPRDVVSDDRLPVKAGAEVVTASSSSPGGSENLPVKAGQGVTPAGVAAVALSRTEELLALRNLLVADGFMNVRVGANGNDLLVVEYENARYNQSQLDGMGVVLGMVVDSAPQDFKTVRLVLKVQDLPIIQVSAPASTLRMFFREAGRNETFSDLVEVSYAIADNRDVTYVAEASFATWFRSRLVLAPRLKTFVATEVSSLDYLLSFAPALYVDLWKGAVLNASATIPFAWSKGFDDGQPFRNSRTDAQFESVMLSQAIAIKPFPGVMLSLGGGMIQHDTYGDLFEAYWYSKEGNHRLGFQQGFGKDNVYNFNRTAYLGSYRYTYTPLDTSLTLTGGSFWDNDTGVRADLSRFFGDTSFSVYYKYSRTTNNQNYQIGGVQISFPLTLRQGMKPYPVQVKGPDEWSYHLETVTHGPTAANTVGVAIGATPPAAENIPKDYYDRDRLTPDYVKTHLLRVRDAYVRYLHPE